MTLRYATTYIVKAGDNLGAASYWNLRLQDIDIRLNAVESYTADINAAATEVINAGIERINTTFQPLLDNLTTQVNTLSSSVSALEGTILTDQDNITTQLNALLTEGASLVAALEALGTIDGGTF